MMTGAAKNNRRTSFASVSLFLTMGRYIWMYDIEIIMFGKIKLGLLTRMQHLNL